MGEEERGGAGFRTRRVGAAGDETGRDGNESVRRDNRVVCDAINYILR